MYHRLNENFDNATPFLRGYQVLKIPLVDDTGASAWPDVFPPARIDALRDAVGARHFSAQMMLEFVPAERIRLDPGQLRFYDAEPDFKAACVGTHKITGASMYWDPSMGRRTGDGSVIAFILRDDVSRCAFIHDVQYMRICDGETHPMARQCEMALDIAEKYGVRRLGVETNGLGNALPEILRDVTRRRGGGPAIEQITNHAAKADRILDALEPMLATGRLYAHVRIKATPLLSEMMGWSPIGAGHDDGLDAVAGALRMRCMPVRAPRAFNAKTDFDL